MQLHQPLLGAGAARLVRAARAAPTLRPLCFPRRQSLLDADFQPEGSVVLCQRPSLLAQRPPLALCENGRDAQLRRAARRAARHVEPPDVLELGERLWRARQGACSAMPPPPHAQRTALHGGPASSLSCGKHQQVIEGQAAETAATSIGLSSTKRHAYAAAPRSWQPTLAAGGSPLVLSMPARTWQWAGRETASRTRRTPA